MYLTEFDIFIREILSCAGGDATQPLWSHCRQANILGRWYLWQTSFLYQLKNCLVSGCFCPMEGNAILVFHVPSAQRANNWLRPNKMGNNS